MYFWLGNFVGMNIIGEKETSFWREINCRELILEGYIWRDIILEGYILEGYILEGYILEGTYF